MQVTCVSASEAAPSSFPSRTHPHANSHPLSRCCPEPQRAPPSSSARPSFPPSVEWQTPVHWVFASLCSLPPVSPPSVSLHAPNKIMAWGLLPLYSGSRSTVSVRVSQVSRGGVFPLPASGPECGPQSVRSGICVDRDFLYPAPTPMVWRTFLGARSVQDTCRGCRWRQTLEEQGGAVPAVQEAELRWREGFKPEGDLAV